MLATEEELACLIHNSSYNRLVCLNNVKARLYLPVTIFLSVLIVVGTLGNTTVCLVYWRRRTSRVSSNYFILSLAILDLVTCVVGMPTEIADLLLPYTFQWPLACKILRFTHSSTIIASSTILIEVAFDRYYRICHLGRQFTAAKAKLLCLGASFLGVVCSWPTFILFGRKTVTRDLGGVLVTGSDCSTADGVRRTMFPMIYYLFLFLLFGLTITFFAVLYSKIGLAVLNRKRVTIDPLKSLSAAQNRIQEEAIPDRCGDVDPAIDKCVKVQVMDASSSEMSSELHNDAYNSDDPGDIYRHHPPCKGAQDSTIGRSVSASTILSSLAGSLRRSGKRRSQRTSSNTRWYTIQPADLCTSHNVEDGDKTRNSAASMRDCLNSSDDKSNPDILSRAASLNKVISAGHTLNVENCRTRCLTQSVININQEVLGTKNAHRLDNKSHSDRDSLYLGENSGFEEGLLESLQKFNLDFNRAFNIGDGCASGDNCRHKLKYECQKMSSVNDMDCESREKSCENKSKPLFSNSKSSDNILLSKDCSDDSKEKSDHTNSKISSADDLPSTSKKGRLINGCNKEFFKQLNIYVSNSKSPQPSCGTENRASHVDQNKGKPQQKIADQVNLGDNKDDTISNANEQLQSLSSQEQQQQLPETQHREQLQDILLCPTPFRRKISTVFLGRSVLATRHRSTSTRHAQRQVRVGKTTTVLFAVTLAYILSFLPYLTVMVLRSVVRDLEENLSPVGELAYKLCVKSFFINNAINPIIYSFLNQTFRSDAKQMFGRMFSTGHAGDKQRVRVQMLPVP